MVDWTFGRGKEDSAIRQHVLDWFDGAYPRDEDFFLHAEYGILRYLQSLIPPGGVAEARFNGGTYVMRIGLATLHLADKTGKALDAHRFELVVFDANPFRGRAHGVEPQAEAAARYASTAFTGTHPPNVVVPGQSENLGLAMGLLSTFLGVTDGTVVPNCRFLLKNERETLKREVAACRRKASDAGRAERFVEERLDRAGFAPAPADIPPDALDVPTHHFHRALSTFLTELGPSDQATGVNRAAKTEATMVWTFAKHVGHTWLELKREGFALDVRPRTITVGARTRPDAEFPSKGRSHANGLPDEPRTIELRITARPLGGRKKGRNEVAALYVSPRFTFSNEKICVTGTGSGTNMGLALFLFAVAGGALDRNVGDKCLDLLRLERMGVENHLAKARARLATLKRTDKALARRITLDPAAEERKETVRGRASS